MSTAQTSGNRSVWSITTMQPWETTDERPEEEHSHGSDGRDISPLGKRAHSRWWQCPASIGYSLIYPHLHPHCRHPHALAPDSLPRLQDRCRSLQCDGPRQWRQPQPCRNPGTGRLSGLRGAKTSRQVCAPCFHDPFWQADGSCIIEHSVSSSGRSLSANQHDDCHYWLSPTMSEVPI